jgi:hypothetical protein
MKVILSKKGFERTYGGFASPILLGERLISLPVPALSARATYGQHAPLFRTFSFYVLSTRFFRPEYVDFCLHQKTADPYESRKLIQVHAIISLT